MTGRDGLVAKKTTDKNGKPTTVYVNPNKGAKSTGKGGEGWATGSPARVSRRNRVESVPTPPSCKPSLGGLAALADEAPVRIHGHMHPTSHVPREGRQITEQNVFISHHGNRHGMWSTTPTGVHYTSFDGRDEFGYDEGGYDEGGYNREGYDALGYDAEGYDRNNWDDSGYHRNGYDRDGYDREGYDIRGLNRDGLTREQVAEAARPADLPHGYEAQSDELFRRIKENADILPGEDSYESGDGYKSTISWAIEGDRIIATETRDMTSDWGAGGAVEPWEQGTADDSAVPRVWDEYGDFKYVGGDEFEAFVAESVDDVNYELRSDARNANDNVGLENEPMDDGDVRDLMADLGFDTDDDAVEIDTNAFWDRVDHRVTYTAPEINREQFVGYLRDRGLYDGD